MPDSQGRVRGLVIAVATAVLLAGFGPVLGPVFSQNAAESARQSQQDEPRPVFRGGAAFVAVDVYPRRDGQVVDGLTAADFEVTEDGKPQAVETFRFITFDAALVDTERRDPTSVADSERQAADPRNRVFVVYLDPYSLSFVGSLAVQSTVMAFLTRTIGPTDLFATMTPKRPPSQLTFGRRLEVLEEDLQQFWRDVQVGIDEIEFRLKTCPEVTSQPIGPAMDRIEREVINRHRQDMLMTSLEGLMRRLGGLKDERKNVLLISEGWNPVGPFPELTEKSRPDVPRVGVSPRGRLATGNQQPHSRDENWCAQQFGRLAHTDFEDRFVQLLDLAREANVTFYPVDVGGLRADRGVSSTLRTLAENTDGAAIFNTNDVSGAVRRLTDSIAVYYLLGYYSTNPTADGRFRKIAVRVKQPGIAVSARRGYFAPTAELLAAATTAPRTGPTPVDVEVGRLARADAEVHAYAVHTGGRLDVVTELASRLMAGPAWRSGAEVRVTARSDAGAPIESQGRIDAGEQSVVLPLALAPGDRGPWTVSVRVTGGQDVLDASALAAPASGPLFGEPLIFRLASSPRAAARAAADRHYRRVERLRVEWRALRPITERAARVLDRQGRPLGVTPVLSDRDDGGQPVVTADLTLAPLAEGDYVIELTGAGGADTERKLLAFRVLR